MLTAKRWKNLGTWLACLAVLLVALMPSLSQALQREASNPWAEICTSLGAKRAAVDDRAANDSAPTAPIEHLLQHCPYCSVHVTVLGMPPTPLPMVSLVPLQHTLPELFLAAPRTLFAWSSAQPRAPPRLS